MKHSPRMPIDPDVATMRIARICFAIGVMVVIALFFMTQQGCAMKGTVVHPGQASPFDGAAFDTLITAQAALEAAKLEAPNFPQFKEQLNQAIASYNATQQAYKLYHTAALAGTSTADQQAQLQNQLFLLVNAIAKVETAFGRKLQ